MRNEAASHLLKGLQEAEFNYQIGSVLCYLDKAINYVYKDFFF